MSQEASSTPVDEPSPMWPGADSQTLVVEASSLPTKTVIVYADRAEVKRAISARLPKGTNEILIQNVSNVIERQSVRVDGTGVLIQEVQYQEIPLDAIPESEKVRALEFEQNDLEKMRSAIEDDIASIEKRIEVLNGVAAQIAVGGGAGIATIPASPSPDAVQPVTVEPQSSSRKASISGSIQATMLAPSFGFLVNDEALSNLVKFLSFYGDTVSGLKAELRSKRIEAERISERIEHLERHIGQLRCSFEYDSVKRNISIIIELDAEKDVELFVTYQVYCAGWKPSYDIRASTANDTDQPSSVTLCYYGLVEQNTGDTWKDADLVLSTATPSVAGCAPPLATLAASLHRPKYSRQRHASAARRKPLSAASEEDMGFGSFDCNELGDAVALHRLVANNHSSEENSVSSPTRSVENIACTCFSIARPVTIPSNGVEHKVLVAQVELACAFFHETVPSKCTSAFLSAIVTNTSTVPILPAMASIYLNNSFISKTHLSAVPPGDEFHCTLGVDPSVKVEYKTPQRAAEQTGFVSKYTLLTHEQTVSLRNAKVGQSIQITVKEQIPKSVDDKIKVAILSPEVKKGGDARLNRENNLEWTCILAPGQQKDLLIKYTVEHPVNETVAYRNIPAIIDR